MKTPYRFFPIIINKDNENPPHFIHEIKTIAYNVIDVNLFCRKLMRFHRKKGDNSVPTLDRFQNLLSFYVPEGLVRREVNSLLRHTTNRLVAMFTAIINELTFATEKLTVYAS